MRQPITATFNLELAEYNASTNPIYPLGEGDKLSKLTITFSEAVDLKALQKLFKHSEVELANALVLKYPTVTSISGGTMIPLIFANQPASAKYSSIFHFELPHYTTIPNGFCQILPNEHFGIHFASPQTLTVNTSLAPLAPAPQDPNITLKSYIIYGVAVLALITSYFLASSYINSKEAACLER
ncbi:MAG: hypothetical protein ACHP6I_02775 [Rickettsiales bacterium]